MYTTILLPEVIKTEKTIPSKYLKRGVELEIFVPDNLLGNEQLNLLLLNDGQDTEELALQNTLAALYGQNKIEPLVVVAIKASKDRLQEYGVSG
jgi:enterochelin esterase-like enzyme